ncbi:MAG: metal-dependent hydrolase [Pelotomaculum sp.]
MKIIYLGHAGFVVQGSLTIIIDPFLTGNPVATIRPDELRADLVLVTHGHQDHMGDAAEIARYTGSTVVSVVELANYLARQGVKTHGMNIGGSHDFHGVKIKLLPAWHSSGIGDGPAEYLGTPCGFLIQVDGKTIYHSGDTGLFGDMELIGRLHPIDLALLPIGDNFTMGPEDAFEAVKMLKPKMVIPMHYSTWPLIRQEPLTFKNEVESATSSKVVVIKPGESYEL